MSEKLQMEKLLKKYPDRVPVRLEAKGNQPDFVLPQTKFVVPSSFSFAQFICSVRKQSNLKPEQALFLFIHNQSPPNSWLISQLYKEHKNEDGCLVMHYCTEDA